MRRIISICFVVYVLLSAAACAQTSPSPTSPLQTPIASPAPPSPDLIRLQVVGNKIVNDKGEIVVLRGLGTNDPVIIAVNQSSDTVAWSEDLYHELHDWGATIVKLSIHPEPFFKNEQRSLEIIDQAIEWAGGQGMYVSIVFHTFGFPPTGFVPDPQDGDGTATDVEGIHFWQTISERYAGNNVVAFYEIFNEPASHPWDGRTHLEDWMVWKDFNELVIDLIRQNDPETIIIVGGLAFSKDLSYVLEAPIERSNIAYADHTRPDTNWVFGDVAEHYPVISTDLAFSIGHPSSYLDESRYEGDQLFRYVIMDYLEERGISWVAVAFTPLWGEVSMIQNPNFEPTEIGLFFQQQLLSHDHEMTTGEMVSEDRQVFAGAVGEWESIDPSDGSPRELTIRSLGDNDYAVQYIDESTPLCGLDASGSPLSGAEANGLAKAFFQKIDIGSLYLVCSSGNGWVGGLLFDTFLYNEETDILIDLKGTAWHRKPG